MKEVSFNAPWGAPLVVMTAVCAVMCLSLSVVGVMIGVGGSSALRTMGLYMVPPWIGWILVVTSFLTLLLSATFMVRGYVLTETALVIKRLGWERRLDLSRLVSATIEPDALERSMRLFGNGGFFAFAGWFRNKKLGVYRAFATDMKRVVVLRFSGKTVVITPDDPQKFVAEISSNKPMPLQS